MSKKEKENIKSNSLADKGDYISLAKTNNVFLIFLKPILQSHYQVCFVSMTQEIFRSGEQTYNTHCLPVH